jgi:hypothetical protein
VTRRPLLAIAAIIAILSLVISACNAGATNAPALTDPKEILTQSLLSLKDLKTVEITGSLTGTLQAAELGGTLDLSSTKITAAVDVPNQKAKFNIDAPSLMSTKLDALVVDGFAYVKIDGLLAGMTGLPVGKYAKTEVPTASGQPVTDTAEIAKQVDEFKAQLDKLPNPPTKEADEKCGDQDCYHTQIKVSAADMAKLSPDTASTNADVTVDLWSRKSDLKPAKLQLTVTSPEIGTVGATFDFKYDVPVDVTAPPADQVVAQ